MAQYERPSLSLSEVCQILSSRYRRHLLSHLQTKDADVADLDELVTHIHKKSEKTTTTEQVRISLIYTHLPKLADYGVIDYDRRNKDVRYCDGTKLEDFLEVLPPNNGSL
ncbi:DUF7344 domain-containing protein [Haladaptatus salinisoli]|uniref:DUF7344 domain-containing protein n=1 Tax=Haladaptatus salinisoli TaxID=2884876 RepID=UPI001D0A1998|nr:hypothetical protein [Haladaptatus salinisoli]